VAATWIALGLLVVVVAGVLNLTLGVRRLGRLQSVPPIGVAEPPAVSVIVAARNEERGIEAALRSLRELDYPAHEVVVVDDRSTDATGRIVDRVAAQDPRITVVHVAELPAGWLGKNHAHFVGAERARGEWLLFTDADVVFHPATLSRAIAHATARGVDHLTMAPRLEVPSALLQAFDVVFAALFCLFTQPWLAPDPRSRFHVGVGAFNLVRRSAYEKAGTHRRIALRPDDDLKLAKILKASGARQELLDGGAFLRVEWYRSVSEMVRGLEKNAFAGLEYRVGVAIGSALALFVITFVPLAGLLGGAGWTRWVSAAAVLLTFLGFADAARFFGLPWWRAALYPLVMSLFIFVVLRTMILNLAHGGIRWRDTFYPLSLLKSNQV
jgi:glycosyltransferase involved in cell wall biosynthesis